MQNCEEQGSNYNEWSVSSISGHKGRRVTQGSGQPCTPYSVLSITLIAQGAPAQPVAPGETPRDDIHKSTTAG